MRGPRRTAIVGMFGGVCLWLALGLAPAPARAAAEQGLRLSASVEPPVAIVGDTVVYRVVVEASGNVQLPQPTFPSFEPFTVLRGSSGRTSISMVIGQQQTVSQSYEVLLRAEKPGHFTIEPSTVEVGKQLVRSNPVQIVVSKEAPESLPAGQVAGLEGFISARTGDTNLDRKLQGRLFLHTEISRNDPVPYEPVFARTYIYKAPQLVEQEGYNFLQDAPSGGEDFLRLPVWRPQNRLEWEPVTVGDTTFQRALVDITALIPTKTGTFTYRGPAMQAQLPVQSPRQRDPFFDDFFGMMGGNRVAAEMPAPPREIAVRPLPRPQPPEFTGIVGDFEVQARVDRPELKEGEIVTLSLVFSGSGYAEAIPEPALPTLDGLALFDKKATPRTDTDRSGIRGGKQFEYMLRASRPGRITIPERKFVLYNPRENKYVERITPALELNVIASETKGPMIVALPASGAGGQVRALATDIAHIHTEGWASRPGPGAALYLRPVWWLLHLLGPLVVLAAYGYRRRQHYLELHPELRRRGLAAGRADSRLRRARRLLKKGDADAFHVEVGAAIRGFLGDKLAREAVGLTQDDIAALLGARGVEAALITEVQSLLDACDAARFAPPGGDAPEKREALLERAGDVLRQLREALA